MVFCQQVGRKACGKGWQKYSTGPAGGAGRSQYALSVTAQRQMHPDDQLVTKPLPVLREVVEALRPVL